MKTLTNKLNLNINKNCRVAIHLDNSQLWLSIDKILTEIDAVIVPIPHFFSPIQIAHMFESVGINKVICEKALENHYLSFGYTAEKYNLDDRFVILSKNITCYPKLPKQTHKITFTSGTTSTPKGVCLSHKHLVTVSQSLASVTQIFNVKKHMSILPLSILLENIASHYAAIQGDIEVITPPLSELGLLGSNQLDVKKLITCIETHKPDSLILMPQMLKALCSFMTIHPGKYNLSFLKFIAVGGAVCSKGLLEQAKKLDLPVFEGYGISECGSVISLNTDSNHMGSVGNILPHQSVKISSDGEILTKGSNFLGYLGKPHETQNQWYATGDLGRFDEHKCLHIIGRKKNIIINSFGRNISPDWIEAELRSIPEIHQAVIYGEAMPSLTAICISHLDKTLVWRKIEQLNTSLPDYARIKHLIVSTTPFSQNNQMLSNSGQYKYQSIFKNFNQPLKENYALTQTIS